MWDCKAELKIYLVFICLCSWPNLLKNFFLPVLCFVIKREHIFVGLYLDILFYFIGLFVSVVSLRFYFLFYLLLLFKNTFIYVCVYLYTSPANFLNSLTHSNCQPIGSFAFSVYTIILSANDIHLISFFISLSPFISFVLSEIYWLRILVYVGYMWH